MARITNKTKATTAGVLGGATVSWLAYEAQRKYGVPADVAGEVVSAIIGGFGGLIARWAAKLDPQK